jgi:hypothetical protein
MFAKGLNRVRGRRWNQEGKGRIGFLLSLFVFAGAIFVAAKLIPVKVRTYQFADYMRDEAQRTAWNKEEAVLRKHLLDKARMLDLPISDKNIDIKIGSGEIRVQARYEVPVDLLVQRFVWKFDQQERAPLF